MATRKALGRGLSALIPPAKQPAKAPSNGTKDPRGVADEEVPRGTLVSEATSVAPASEESGGPLFIAVERIAPNPNQPRKIFRDEELATLSASIREQGILQPLVVRKRGSSAEDGYELIIGERRWRASQLAGLREVPAVIIDAGDRAVLEMALVENVQRQDLNPMELARSFKLLIDQEEMTQEEVGRRVGLDRSTVANHLRLLDLPDQVQQDLIDQRLTMGHAKAVLAAPEAQQAMLRDQILRGGLSVRASEEVARRLVSTAPDAPAGGKPTKRQGKRDPQIVALEEELRRVLQTKVRIVGSGTRGRLELSYYGAGELDRLTEMLFGGAA